MSTSFFCFCGYCCIFRRKYAGKESENRKGACSNLKKWWKAAATGIAAGFLNGLFGSGGGMVAVPMFKKSGLSVKEAHATSVLMMAALSAASAGLYLFSGRLEFGEALGFIPAGIVGGIAGSLLFKNIKSVILRRIFGAFIVFSALKILWGQVAG